MNFGITSFDNIITSLLSVFQIITSDTWHQQIYNFMDADIPFFGVVYCLFMLIVGQFFLLNLFLAVIVFAFIKSQQEDVQNEISALRKERQQPEAEKPPLALKEAEVSPEKREDGEGNNIVVGPLDPGAEDKGKLDEFEEFKSPPPEVLMK